MLVLKPREYKLNGKWSLVPRNRVDTVSFSLITNEITEAEEQIHVESFQNANVGTEQVQLPISNYDTPTHYRWMVNNYWRFIQGTQEYAKARVDCVIATGSRSFTLEKAVKGTPTVKVVLNGTSSVITRGDSSFENFPSSDSLKNKNFSLANWIEEHKTSTNSFLSWDYAGTNLSMNPWVRKVIPTATYENGNPAFKQENIPTYADVYTRWANQDESFSATSNAHFDGWSEGNDIGSKSKKVYMLTPDAKLTSGVPEFAESVAIQIADIKIPIEVSITKHSEYNYSVKWRAPVRFTYMAASQNSDFTGDHEDVDNWAFVDNITSVDVVLSGKPYSDETVDTVYVLNDVAIESSVIGDNPISIEDCELFTTQTVINETDKWSQHLATSLLQQYKDGKYIVEVTVKAAWALHNDVHVNTQLQLYLPDGTLLKRKGVATLFEVKNIEKSYDQNEFVYILKLMEV